MGRGKNVDIAVFLDGEGKIKQLPTPARTRMPVLAYLAEKFETDRRYSEKEVNAIIDAWHTFGDYFILRRLLVDSGFMARRADGSAYWRIAEPAEKGGEKSGQEKRTETPL